MCESSEYLKCGSSALRRKEFFRECVGVHRQLHLSMLLCSVCTPCAILIRPGFLVSSLQKYLLCFCLNTTLNRYSGLGSVLVSTQH